MSNIRNEKKLIDIHHHLIYGVDDGAQTWEDTKEMLKKAHENGISNIVATSHATPGRHEFPAETYLRHLERAQNWCDDNGLDLKLHIGCEIFYTDEAPRLVKNGYIPTLDATWTVLVEFGLAVTFEQLCDAARQFGNVGYRMIAAHIERYGTLHNLKQIRTLRDDYDVIMQMNARTVLAGQGLFGDRWVRKVLDEGLIDLVGTDAHNTSSRPCNLRSAYDYLVKHYDEDYADRLCCECQREVLML